MTLFEAANYREYIKSYVQSLPKGGRGELSKMSQALAINTTHMSQVMSGVREFNSEQADELSHYLGHSELEADYFLILVQIERAGTEALKKRLEKKRQALLKESTSLAKVIRYDRKLTDEERGVFYSSWLYSAIHLATSLSDEGLTFEQICARFEVTKARAKEILQFLLATALVKEQQGRYWMGTQSTHLQFGSPHLAMHHHNWRIKAIQKTESLTEEELMYSGQLSLSRADFTRLREMLTEFVRSANEIVRDSKAQDLAALNIDWFWIERN